MLRPYNYASPDEGVSFHFTTESYITYSLALSDYSELFGILGDSGCKLLFIVLTPINPPEIIPLDLRVKDTVVSFLIEYLSKHPDVIFYVCSTIGGKEGKRQKAFDWWYQKHNPGLIKKEVKIIEGSNTYFLFAENNTLAESILQLIDEYNNS